MSLGAFRCGEAIADAAHGLQIDRSAGVVFQLGAEPAHVNVERPGIAKPIGPPNLVKQALAGDDRADIGHQQQEDFVFFLAQRDRLAAPGDDVGVHVEHDVTRDDPLRALVTAVHLHAAQHGADVRFEFLIAEGLDQIVVRADLQAL